MDAPDEFVITLPVFSYLIEPGPRPGFLQHPTTKVAYVPLWTDDDQFDRFLTESGLAGRVSGLCMNTVPELVTFLKHIPAQVQDVMVDPLAKAPAQANTWKIAKMLVELAKAER